MRNGAFISISPQNLGNRDLLDERPSRAQKKRDLAKIRELGEQLVNLSPGKYAKLVLPEQVRDAVTLCRRLTEHNGIRRQLQYIQSVLEAHDSVEIQAALKMIDHAPAAPVAAESPPPSAADLQIDALLEGGDAAIFELANRSDPTELQVLRQAVRQAKKLLAEGKPRAIAVKNLRTHLARLSRLSRLS